MKKPIISYKNIRPIFFALVGFSLLIATIGLCVDSAVLALVIPSAIMILALVVYFIKWRCPHCGAGFGNNAFPEFCPQCGEKISK
jgi:uncharacterized membrane protein